MTRPSALACVFALLLGAAGCAVQKDYTPPPKAVLQDALPEHGIVYLLRSPYDGDRLDIFLNGQKTTQLPGGRYTVLSLTPGTYVIRTFVNGEPADKSPVPDFQFSLADQQRLLLHLPAPERKYVPGLSFAVVGKGLLVPISGSQQQSTDFVRSWTITEEADVHWFIHYSKLYLEPLESP